MRLRPFPLTRREHPAKGVLRAMMPWRWRLTPIVIGAVVALVLGLCAGAAYGYFSSTGSGTGSTTAGTVQSVHVVAASGTVSSELIPGGSGDLLVAINNPNSYSVTITGISQNGSVTAVGGIGTCTTTGVSVPTQTGLSITVVSGPDVVVTVPNGASMSASSDSGCQGASFQVPVTVTVQR